ncbi:ATP-binding cassette, subfamily B, HlyB/CyaB [Enhydrobacter aerosaccus]|uniref:ATP-binding cassette, subfamily B, HlyB/CyaB n=2 Tax=Enhydrobacter aerosaccus TaxID=225324 RepID=A0A1T4RR77_9HYPH|nr:ATP-binding cassette, subfamily B, HlyB/CyaB [Enhydrobacter aerosaccus]
MLRFLGKPIEPDQLRHKFAPQGELFSAEHILRAAKHLELRADIIRVQPRRLAGTVLPAIACLKDGTFTVLARATDDRVLLQNVVTGQPVIEQRSAFDAQWNGEIIPITTRERASGPERPFGLTWFIPSLVRFRKLLGEALIASLFLQLFALVTPLFTQVVIDKVLVHKGWSTLDVLVFGLVVVSIFEVLLSGMRAYVLAHTTNRIDVELGARLFRHLVNLPLAYFGARRVGDSVARVRELENIRQFLTGQALTIGLDVAFAGVFVAIMWFYSWQLTLMVMAAIPVWIGIVIVAAPLWRRRLNEKFDRGAENQAFLVENVSSIETVKAMAVEPQMQRGWEDKLAAYVGASFRVTKLAVIASHIIELTSKLLTAAILWVGAGLVIGGKLTVGELVAINMLVGRVTGPILRMGQVWQDFQQIRISVARLGDILNTPSEPRYTASRATPPRVTGHIVFDHVSFRYRPDAREVLSDVSLDLPAGQVVGIVGRSGSGKSTLGRLVQRLYVPSSGRILIDGLDIGVVDPSWLRRQIGVVLQENLLFNRTIRENIALADPAAPIEAVMRVAQLAGAHDFILDLPEGYDSRIEERGANLSGGQRQRIAIARALMADPRILIFDEATSALDAESEEIVQKNMQAIVRGRTVLIIAHRLSALRVANRILSVEHGRIIEDGTHADLLRANGRYADLWRRQMGMTTMTQTTTPWQVVGVAPRSERS